MARFAAGLVIAAVITALARRASALSTGGAIAAMIVGTMAIAAGWDWALLLLAFFISSSALSRLGSQVKEARTRGMLDKQGPRDSRQVAANGALFTLAALLFLIDPWPGWGAAGAGALATATADTWGTEVGVLSRSQPRSITTFQPVQVGQSGGVSPLGLVATLAGAALISALAWLVGWGVSIASAALAGGVAGAVSDSLLGALWQGRRRCPHCDALTERRVHHCGARTLHRSGAAWLDNDGVNALAGALGVAVTLSFWTLAAW
ncbi:MAG TPA: DUF92 domain-containing protein [Gemmatimonadaceae bacterium]|nr:DUF92 domain-containing protein [Gemmatimonadaceae bacterium]